LAIFYLKSILANFPIHQPGASSRPETDDADVWILRARWMDNKGKPSLWHTLFLLICINGDGGIRNDGG
jgi:hypothetical protein